MAQMNISNLLWNDTQDAKIAYAEQVYDRVVDWEAYHYVDDTGVVVYPFRNKSNVDKFQTKLNQIFLAHYNEFQAFLNSKLEPGVIDSWKDIEDFLRNISDDESITLMNIIGSLQEASGQLNVRMSSSYPGMMEAVTKTETPNIGKSYIDSETGAIMIVYSFEDGGKSDLGNSFKYSTDAATATVTGELANAPILTNTKNVPVTFNSTNPDVATIAQDGTVTVKRDGETIISASYAGSEFYNPKTVSYRLTVALAFDVNDYVDTTTEIDSPEFKEVVVDSEEKVLWGKHHDDTTTDIDLSNDFIDGISVQRIVDAVVEQVENNN